MRAQPKSGELANVYMQLDRLQRAGIPLQQAFETADTGRLTSALRDTAGQLASGRRLSGAGQRSGWLRGLDATLIQAAEETGEYPFARLGELHRGRQRRLDQIRGRLILPLGVLGIALLARPLPALVAGDVNLPGYLFASFGVMLLLAGLVGGFWLAWIQSPALRDWVAGLALVTPGLGRLRRLAAQVEFSRATGMLHEAGVPLLRAVELAVDTVTDPRLRRELEPMVLALQGGASFTDALAKSPLIGRDLRSLAGTGEQSGRLGEMLLHHTRLRQGDLESAQDALAAWIPRIVYLLIALWMAASLLSGGPPGSIEAIEAMDRQTD